MNARKIRPSLYKFDNLPWAWVRLAEVAQCVGMDARGCWAQYFSYLYDEEIQVLIKGEEKPRIYVDQQQWDGTGSGRYRYDQLTEKEARRAYIPAGAAKRVLDSNYDRRGDVIRRGYEHYQKPYAYMRCMVYNLTLGTSWVHCIKLQNDPVLKIPIISDEDLSAFNEKQSGTETAGWKPNILPKREVASDYVIVGE